MLSPLEAARLPQLLAQAGKGLSEQAIDLGREKFALFVPSAAPPGGYGLIVFVPPWNAPAIPDGWAEVLERYGIIFVAAAQSGNDASVLGRREPLAILAEQNVVRRYPVNPARIYISGFSGGSRVALRLALGYADVFRAAILNAGADPVGGAGMPLPPREIFRQFQETTHLVYVTGDRDMFVLSADAASRHSLRNWCVSDVDNQTEHATGHDVMTPAALARALDALAVPERPDADSLASCRAGIESDLRAKLEHANSLIAAGQQDAARALLHDIDAQYGGLAAPESVRLQNALAPK
jgi:pimeloyl-ACP methyl ester carboxylesterase